MKVWNGDCELAPYALKSVETLSAAWMEGIEERSATTNAWKEKVDRNMMKKLSCSWEFDERRSMCYPARKSKLYVLYAR